MAEVTGMPSFGAQIFRYDFPSGGLLPAARANLANAVEIPQVREITAEGDEVGAVKITHLTSYLAAEDVIPGWYKAKTITGVCIYSETNLQIVRNMLPLVGAAAAPGLARGRNAWVILYPDGSSMLYIGFLSVVGDQIPAAGNDDPITFPFTIQTSGPRRFVDVV